MASLLVCVSLLVIFFSMAHWGIARQPTFQSTSHLKNQKRVDFSTSHTPKQHVISGHTPSHTPHRKDATSMRRGKCTSESESPMGASYRFLTHLPLRLPDDFSLPMEQILKEEWVCDLQSFLSHVSPRTRLVNMIAANSNFTEPLLNWLIAARVKLDRPLRDVIVLCLDSSLHQLLTRRGIPALLVVPESVMRTSEFPKSYHRHNRFYQTRMIVMRLVNHWGFHVANYDTDAILLRNPEPIYDSPENADIDIFAGFAISFPPQLHRKWGATVCNGAWMVRSNPETGILSEIVGADGHAQ